MLEDAHKRILVTGLSVWFSLHDLAARAEEIHDLAEILSEELSVPEPEKKPPPMPAKKRPVAARGNTHEGGEALQKRIAATYRPDHPAYEIARRAALRKTKR
jgi:hypothetical protein